MRTACGVRVCKQAPGAMGPADSGGRLWAGTLFSGECPAPLRWDGVEGVFV